MPKGASRLHLPRVVVTGALVALLLAIGAAPATAEGEGVDPFPLPEQPDALVSKNARTYAGNGVYNTTGAGQTMSRNAARGTTVRFYVRTLNDGDEPIDVSFRGCAGNSSFKVTYFGVTPILIDYTPQVVAGFTGLVMPGPVGPDWVVEVKVKRTAPAGATLNCKFKLSATDESLTTRRDTVLMTVRRS